MITITSTITAVLLFVITGIDAANRTIAKKYKVDGLWIIEANLNISNQNIIVISTSTRISIWHALAGQYCEHLFYRQYTDHLKYLLCPNIPLNYHLYSTTILKGDEVNDC